MKCTFMFDKESHAKVKGYTYIAHRGMNLIKKFYSRISIKSEMCIQERRNSLSNKTTYMHKKEFQDEDLHPRSKFHHLEE